MSTDKRKQALEKEIAALEKAYGHKAAALGSKRYKLNVVPTGSTALDYALGIGGWPLGHPVEVFGNPDIGKSSVVGYSAIRGAQSMGLLCGIVAYEPGFDETWAIKNGIDPDMLLIARPQSGEEAFAITHRWLRGDLIDFIVFDSIGAVLSESEIKEDGKPKAGGQAGLVTWGIKNTTPIAWRNNKGIIFLNQVRDVMNSRFAQVQSPGGWALEHGCAIRVHLKKADVDIKEKVPGYDDAVVVGRHLQAKIIRNKLSEGSNKTAEFDYYIMDTPTHKVGIDVGNDIINTALRNGVIEKAGGFYRHSSFGEKPLQGRPAVIEFLLGDERALAQVREEVLAVMVERHGEPVDVEPEEAPDEE